MNDKKLNSNEYSGNNDSKPEANYSYNSPNINYDNYINENSQFEQAGGTNQDFYENNPYAQSPYAQNPNVNNPYTNSSSTYVHNSYGQDPNAYYATSAYDLGNPYAYLRPKSTSGYSITSLVLGILSFLVCCCLPSRLFAIISLIVSITAIVMGILGIKQVNQNPFELDGKGLSVTGIVASSISLLLALILIIMMSIFTSVADGINKRFSNWDFSDFENFENFDDFNDFFKNFSNELDSENSGDM